MKKNAALALCVGLFTLGGCANQLPPLNFAAPNVGVSQHKIDAELRSLIVAIARPDEQKGDVDIMLVESAGTEASTGGSITSKWKDALEDSLNKMAIFRDDVPTKVNLSVKVLKLDVPSMGTNFETNTIARYEIMNRANGDLIFTTDISSIGSTEMGYAFLGVIRAREAANRSVQNNISQFLQQLETVDISKPMFPQKTQK